MKKKIVIASVLKPVDDVRMYEKFAKSILKHFPEYEIHILGAKSTKIKEQQNLESGIWNETTNNQQQTTENIFFYPIADFHRLSMSRWKYGRTFVEFVLKIAPDLLIINSSELLLPSLFIKMKSKIPVFYDVRENYFRNILYQPTYSPWLRLPLALTVRVLEYLSRLWVNKYLLAEKNYEKEFDFSKSKSEVIENKYNQLAVISEQLSVDSYQLPVNSQIWNETTANQQLTTINQQSTSNNIKQQTRNFIYTGTISHIYGTVRAIHFIKKIKTVLPESQLLIKGFCSDKNYLELLKNEARDNKGKNLDFIKLEISEIPMNHQEIIACFSSADVALMPYLPNKSTENCIPAKMYEYIRHLLPMIVQKNPLWEEVCAPCQAALFINFNDFEATLITEKLKSTAFYSRGNTNFALWETEEHKLIRLISENL